MRGRGPCVAARSERNQRSVPVSTSRHRGPGLRAYRVKAGDCLYRISVTQGVVRPHALVL